MNYKTTLWNSETQQQEERDCTPEEIAEILLRQLPQGPIVPVEVSPRQIRQALTAAGLRTQIEMAVASADQDTKDWWEFATTFERAHPMVIAMATGLEVTTTELDELFILAGSL